MVDSEKEYPEVREPLSVQVTGSASCVSGAMARPLERVEPRQAEAVDGDCAPDGFSAGMGSPDLATPRIAGGAPAGGSSATVGGRAEPNDGNPDDASGSYPCTLDINGASQVKGTIYEYPDGGTEVVLYETHPLPLQGDDSCSSDSSSNDSSSVLWVGVDSDRVIPSVCPRAAYVLPAVDALGNVIAHGIRKRLCPWLSLNERIASEFRSGQRAKTKVRRLARANSLRYMTTLTVPEGMDRSRSSLARLWRGFSRTRGGSRFFRHGALVVLEPHKRGGYHLHILHANRLPAVLVREHWTRYLVRECGVSLPAGVSFVRTHEKDWGDGRRAAHYAAKYVSKVFGSVDKERRSGEHRYLRSRSLVVVGKPVEFPDWDSALAWLPARGRRFSSEQSGAPCPIAWHWAEFDPLRA